MAEARAGEALSGAPAGYDRFAGWKPWWARVVLAVVLALLAASAMVPLAVGNGKGGAEVAKTPSLVIHPGADKTRPRDDDLALYDRAISRIRHGENYYDFIVSEHRRAHYPVRPGLAVRLPTLAYLDAAMGVDGDAPAPMAMAAALALAIREHTLPFVLLLGAFALWRRQWREAAAWGALVALFGAGLAWHLHLIAAQALPSDPIGPSWFALRGLGGWLSNVVLSSNLRFLPHVVAGPLVVLMVLGWAGWRSAAGAFGTLLYVGYGVAFMIAGRNDNFYWGAVIAPAMFIGLAFVPMAAKSLVKAALAKATPAG